MVDFIKICFYKSWSCGSWSHKSWSRGGNPWCMFTTACAYVSTIGFRVFRMIHMLTFSSPLYASTVWSPAIVPILRIDWFIVNTDKASFVYIIGGKVEHFLHPHDYIPIIIYYSEIVGWLWWSVWAMQQINNLSNYRRSGFSKEPFQTDSVSDEYFTV